MPFNKFEPTPEQRETVQLMAFAKKPLDEIAAEIINSVTGKPITRNTLSKLFAADIKRGKSTLVLPALKQLKAKIDAGERWAIEDALKMGGLLVDGSAASTAVTDPSVHNRVINIVGIAPSPKPGDLPPPGPYDPRPLPKWEHRDEADKYPHRIEAKAAPSPPEPEPQLFIHTPTFGKPWIGPK